jgi:hypothetical protein
LYWEVRKTPRNVVDDERAAVVDEDLGASVVNEVEIGPS